MNRTTTATAALLAGLALTLTPPWRWPPPQPTAHRLQRPPTSARSAPHRNAGQPRAVRDGLPTQGTVSGTKTGDVVRILNANNQPAAGFTPFKIGSPIRRTPSTTTRCAGQAVQSRNETRSPRACS